jgi:carboxyl-terminal processing protease
VTTPQADSSFLQGGQFVGFGFRTRIDGDRLFIPEVYEDSPAEDGGLARGTEITHIDSGSGFVPVATLLQADPNLEQAFGAATEGVQLGFRFIQVGGQQLEDVFVKRIVTIAPVPPGSTRILALPSNPAVPVGYVNLRTFISTADAPLRSAYAQFRAQGVQYFIVDLRYNGGGLVSIADLVGDLNGEARDPTDVFETMRFKPAKSGSDSVRRFIGQPQSVDPVRIAFIMTEGTASASELVVNAMKPWAEVAIVGADTYGKPVGQTAFDLNGCDLRLRLVTFRITNADGEGDYYEGLADTLPFACAAEDDLTRAPWDPDESSTAEALGWLGTGACSDILSVPGQAFLRAGAGRRLPRAARPSPAQAWLPGLY